VVSCGGIERLHRDQPGHSQELVGLVEDPVAPVPGFSVRNAPHARRDSRDDLTHHRLGVGQVDAAIEMNVLR
jgi:hypothetical protein